MSGSGGRYGSSRAMPSAWAGAVSGQWQGCRGRQRRRSVTSNKRKITELSGNSCGHVWLKASAVDMQMEERLSDCERE